MNEHVTLVPQAGDESPYSPPGALIIHSDDSCDEFAGFDLEQKTNPFSCQVVTLEAIGSQDLIDHMDQEEIMQMVSQFRSKEEVSIEYTESLPNQIHETEDTVSTDVRAV